MSSSAVEVNDLASQRCRPCEGGVDPLNASEVEHMLEHLQGWAVVNGAISKTYAFKNYYQTMAFVNATAWLSHREDHHPDMSVGYNSCTIAYKTHAINGLSQNDFICAAKIDKLFEL